MSEPLLLDTGGWLYALAGREPYAEALKSARPAIVPALVLAEVDWHLRRQRRAMRRLLAEISEGRYVYEPPSVRDLGRANEIDKKFTNLSLGLVDATVVALAERLDAPRILTIDSDFVAVRFGRGWRQHFELAVALPRHAS